MTVSIIIAVKTWQKNLEECVDNCRNLDFSDFEIIILPDYPLDKDLVDPRISIIPTGEASPARKRDTAINYAQGEILAFLDDDAYPARDWLNKAIENFKDQTVAAVGGPAITAIADTIMQQASGLVYSSILVSANLTYRYIPGKKREVDDYPSCNFLVRKSIMQELGGFLTDFWPGEDTKLCLDITKRLGKKIIYDPEVIVWHHRRPLFSAHLKQVASYAMHRGYFVKRFPETSRKLSFFIPSLFLLFLMSGAVLSVFSLGARILFLSALSVYLFLSLIFAFSRNLYLAPLVFLGIISTHIVYGSFFLKGLLSSKLREE